MMHDSGLPKSFWTQALQTAVYLKNRVFCKGAGRTPYEMMYGARPDLHHIRAFGSLVYCHTPIAKWTKLSMNCKVGFPIGYQEDVVGCQVYFPTEHKKGFVADVKVNETIKYKDRYGTAFKTKVNKWLQTFDEFFEDGDFDDSDSDSEEASQQAECDAESVRDDSNVEMVSVAGSGHLDADEQTLWNDMVQNSVLPKYDDAPTSTSRNLDDNERQVWEDILHNSSLPDYNDASDEKQEGGNTGIASVHADISDKEDSQVNGRAESDDDEFEGNAEKFPDDEYAAATNHVSDLTQVPEDVVSEEHDYDCLFDPNDARKAEHDCSMSDEVEDPPPQTSQSPSQSVK
ncbi:Copia type Polyprotein, partial [Phytophthora megakarya]